MVVIWANFPLIRNRLGGIINNMANENTTQKLSTRFINAYNQIDHALRLQYNFKTNVSFTDLIRRCSSLNTVIRSYEDDLIAHARLRNAIVHSSSEEIIAEPHEDVVELTEKIARIISTPPLAINALRKKDVATVKSSVTLREVVVETSRLGYSNLPIYKNGALIGVISWNHFVEVLGSAIIGSGMSVDNFLTNTTAEEFVREFPASSHYVIVSAEIAIEEVLKLFNQNRKLICVIITKTGNYIEPPIGIITGADVMDLMRVLEDF
jgi:predicted transcriptional regulator